MSSTSSLGLASQNFLEWSLASNLTLPATRPDHWDGGRIGTRSKRNARQGHF